MKKPPNYESVIFAVFYNTLQMYLYCFDLAWFQSGEIEYLENYLDTF